MLRMLSPQLVYDEILLFLSPESLELSLLVYKTHYTRVYIRNVSVLYHTRGFELDGYNKRTSDGCWALLGRINAMSVLSSGGNKNIDLFNPETNTKTVITKP